MRVGRTGRMTYKVVIDDNFHAMEEDESSDIWQV